MHQLTILHTNDLHSQLDQWPYVTSLIKQKRQEALERGDDVLLFDIGDHSDRANPITEGLMGRGNVELLNAMNYDAVTIGNNEGITFSKQQLNDLYQDATFEVLLGNLYDDDKRATWCKPSTTYTLQNGTTIGVIGVTIPFYSFYDRLGWKATDAAEAIAEEIERLQDCDFLILLSHLGLSTDEQLATDYPKLDLILGSHTHHILENGKKVNRTWINQCGRSGTHLGEVTVQFDPSYKEIRVVSHPVVDVEEDAETTKLLEKLERESAKSLNEEIAEIEERLAVDWYEPSPFTTLLGEALTEWCEADLSMVNAGVLLDSIQHGAVTKRMLHQICPHPINPAKVRVKGETILQVIEESASKDMVHLKLHGFGFRGKVVGYTYFDHVTQKGDTFYIRGEQLELHKDYTLATLDMYTFSPLYPVLQAQEARYYMPEFLRDVLAWKLKQQVIKPS
ncbi:bifunctional metallophosphatase/5'-nucleotidase [Paenalkalicoccus suaedae]|uniref:Bifunctional metallophosphatase/5'-nucleotidase n=1 Tax=Paenalkalicoccus suaedae TaxID=2592382 RepID=A0A859FGN5_9BACI|nr:bifunctional UDP-sugar hydrolase/5'-nucleotidase [Paenalkalicoccus suaedae]QKS72201.1 bifunctional metallophosphatase/5'-nucleotidase [Paenalkalicoccus suaedae]